MSHSDEVKAALGALAAVVVVVLLWVGYSMLEARAWQRVTGRQVSTWEAMFLELRVEDGAP